MTTTATKSSTERQIKLNVERMVTFTIPELPQFEMFEGTIKSPDMSYEACKYHLEKCIWILETYPHLAIAADAISREYQRKYVMEYGWNQAYYSWDNEISLEVHKQLGINNPHVLAPIIYTDIFGEINDNLYDSCDVTDKESQELEELFEIVATKFAQLTSEVS